MHTSTKLSSALLCAALIFGSACSDDTANNNGGNTNNNGGNNNNNNNGSATKTSYDIDVTGGGGMDTEVKNEIDNSQASQQNGGVAIADGRIFLYLVAPSGTTISAVVATTESAQAPGSFSIVPPPDDNHAVLLDPLGGGTFSSTGGTIRINNCPTKVGDKLTGAFSNVTVAPDAGGNQTRTLNGSFDLYVYSMAGTLFCKPTNTTNNNTNNTNNNTNNNNGGTCRADQCLEGGTCCPHAQCLTQCQIGCFQDPRCSDPFNADPVGCAACNEGCLDSCSVSAACRTAIVDLYTCEEANGCDAIEDEAQNEACVKANCCAELNAAL